MITKEQIDEWVEGIALSILQKSDYGTDGPFHGELETGLRKLADRFVTIIEEQEEIFTKIADQLSIKLTVLERERVGSLTEEYWIDVLKAEYKIGVLRDISVLLSLYKPDTFHSDWLNGIFSLGQTVGGSSDWMNNIVAADEAGPCAECGDLTWCYDTEYQWYVCTSHKSPDIAEANKIRGC